MVAIAPTIPALGDFAMLWAPRSGILVAERPRARSGFIASAWLPNVAADWAGGVLGLGVLIS